MVGVRKSLNAASAAALVMAALLACIAVGAVARAAAAEPPEIEFVKKFGHDGTEATTFGTFGAGPVAVDQADHSVYAADGTSGKLYKFDGEGNPVSWGGAAPYLAGNELSGLPMFGSGERQIAVDSTNHVIYVASANSIRAFQADGEPSEFTAGPGAGSNTIGGFGRLTGLAVDPNGFIYASDLTEGIVKIFTPSGEEVKQFSVENPTNLAVDSTGAIYVVRHEGTVVKVTPSSFPVTPSTNYTVAGSPVDPKRAQTVGVNPATNDVYIVYIDFFPGVAIYDEDGTFLSSFGEPGSAGELHLADGIAIDGQGTRIYIGNNKEEGFSQVYVFREQPPAAPTVEDLGVSNLSNSSATLNARINPNSVSTTYRFEYGLADCSTSLCTSIPIGGASIGSGHHGFSVAQQISGLEAGTEYHYAVVAENELGSDEESGVFKTQSNDLSFKLSDSRVWEMVSPTNKQGAQLHGSAELSGGGQIQAAADGNGIAYVSTSPVVPGAEGNRAFEPSSVLAHRDGAGWHSQDITTPNDKVSPIPLGKQGEYKLFSPDLSKAILDPRSGMALSPEASERAPYLRINTEPPSYRPLVTGKEGFANVEPGIEFGGSGFFSDVTIQNATPDLSHVVLESRVALVAGKPAPDLYEWADGLLKPVNVLPGAEEAVVPAEKLGSGPESMRQAISSDGSRIFWTGLTSPNNHLYMREMDTGETVQIDTVHSGGGGGEVEPVFQGASSDGTVVFFTDTERLTEDASPSGSDLYRCEITDPAAGCVNFVDLTAPRASLGESAEVLGVASGLSEAGTRMYFVAKGIVAGNENEFGDSSAAGQPNLYLWEAGQGVRFVARLAAEDSPDWGRLPLNLPYPSVSLLSTAVSPSGRYFAFMSQRNLTGQANVDVTSGEAVERVFRYDAASGRLNCVSCNPAGASPRGILVGREEQLVDPRIQWDGHYVSSNLPEPEITKAEGHSIYQPRVVLENGRVFFNSIDSLVPADSNSQWDVYQYEDLGVGDCSATSGNAAIARSGEGCVSLISSGAGDAETGFLDASVSGDDVFFLTPARLAVTDVDNELDLYDARVNGTAAVLNPPTECSGESCRSVAPQVPDATPGSASFNGVGNVRPALKCPKGKHRVRKHGKKRCVPRKKGKHHRRAGHRKGAGR